MNTINQTYVMRQYNITCIEIETLAGIDHKPDFREYLYNHFRVNKNTSRHMNNIIQAEIRSKK